MAQSSAAFSTPETHGGFPKLGVPFWRSLFNKDYSILGSILGYPNFGKLPHGGFQAIVPLGVPRKFP